MDDRWMIGVLSDLQAFADLNGMYELGEKISEAEDMARTTLARRADQSGVLTAAEVTSDRNVH